MKATPKKPATNRTFFRSAHGSVRVYTPRHLPPCLFRNPDQQTCSCPKWIYSKPRDGKPSQKAARTPSFTEACEIAQKLLRGFDPEIQAARGAAAKHQGGTIAEAASEFLAMQRSNELSKSYRDQCSRLLAPRDPAARKKCGAKLISPSLLDFLAANYPATTMLGDLTTRQCDKWAETWACNDRTHLWRRTVFSAFLKDAIRRGLLLTLPPQITLRRKLRKGNRCGMFTEEEYQRLLQAIDFHPYRGLLPANYAARMRAFLEIGRWAGMAVVDIVKFNPAKDLDGDVVMYRRAKTGTIAGPIVIPMTLANRLRAIPPEPGYTNASHPLALDDLSRIGHACQIWRLRFETLVRLAKIGEVTTEAGIVRNPHPHMLRDTFAIDAICRGIPLHTVSKMLGHTTTQMTEKNYFFWVEKAQHHAIAQQRAVLGDSQHPIEHERTTAPTHQVQ